MASFSGNIPTPSNQFNLLLEYNYTQEIEKNQTTINTIKGYVKRNNANAYPFNTTKDASIKIEKLNEDNNWVEVITLTDNSAYNLSSDGYKEFVSGSNILIGHKNNGKQRIKITFSVDGKLNSYYPLGSISEEIDLTTIPRASQVTCSSANIGETAIVVIVPQLNNAYHDLTYKIGTTSSAKTGTIATKTQTTTLSLDTSSMKDEIYALIPNDTQISCVIECKTYIKENNTYTQIGDTELANFYLYAKEIDCNPIINSTVIETNSKVTDLLQANNVFIKGISLPKVTINATARLSSTIKNYVFDLNNGTNYISNNENQYTFSKNLTDKLITTKVIDSRNYISQYDIDVSQTPYKYIDYINLTLGAISLSRTEDVSNEIILNCAGSWFNNSFTNDIENDLVAKFQYKKSRETEWSTAQVITPTIEENTFKFENYSLGNIYDFDNEYQFKIIINDKLSSVEDEETVSKGQEVIAIGDDKGWLYGTWKLNDNIMGVAKNEYNTSTTDTYNCSYINKLFNKVYSNEEKRIGTWIDGKPLYQKTIYFDTALSSNELNNFPHNIENIDFIFAESAFVVNNVESSSSYRWSYPLPIGLYNSNTDEDKLGLFVSRWGIRFFVQTSWGTNWTKYIVLNYTKTTDT